MSARSGAGSRWPGPSPAPREACVASARMAWPTTSCLPTIINLAYQEDGLKLPPAYHLSINNKDSDLILFKVQGSTVA